MANFKNWLEGKKDLFNQEVEPYKEVNIPEIDEEEVKKSYSANEKMKIISRRIKEMSIVHLALSIITFVIYVGVLIAFTTHLSEFGENNVTWNFVSKYYIENALEDTKSVNSVTGMILDYRAFDTLGESFVLFSAVTCVFVLLQGMKEEKVKENRHFIVHLDPIVRYVASVIVPLVLVFGVYVVLNGHLSPGGGFSGGAILGAGLIVFSLAFGDEVMGKFFKLKTFKTISAIALLGYASTKAYSFFMSGLHYHDPILEWFHNTFKIGSILSGNYILILNICVGAVVACTMYGFYSLFKKGEI